MNKRYESKKTKLEKIKKRKSDGKDDDKNSRDNKKPKKEQSAWFFERQKDGDLYKPREWICLALLNWWEL